MNPAGRGRTMVDRTIVTLLQILSEISLRLPLSTGSSLCPLRLEVFQCPRRGVRCLSMFRTFVNLANSARGGFSADATSALLSHGHAAGSRIPQKSCSSCEACRKLSASLREFEDSGHRGWCFSQRGGKRLVPTAARQDGGPRFFHPVPRRNGRDKRVPPLVLSLAAKRFSCFSMFSRP